MGVSRVCSRIIGPLSLAVFGWSACNGGGTNPTTPSGTPTPAAVDAPYFSTNIAPAQSQMIAQDFKALAGSGIDAGDQKLMAMTGTSDSSAASLINWFNTRIRYVAIGDGILFRLNKSDGSSTDYNFAMSANGAQYLHGLGALLPYFQENYPGVQSFDIVVDPTHFVPAMKTDATGVINLGDEFFTSPLPANPDSIVGSIYRLSILMHEARHADGEQFNHVLCPDNSSFPGTVNCDSRPDGAYELQVEFIDLMMRAMPNLSVEENQALGRMLFDYLGRLVRSPNP